MYYMYITHLYVYVSIIHTYIQKARATLSLYQTHRYNSKKNSAYTIHFVHIFWTSYTCTTPHTNFFGNSKEQFIYFFILFFSEMNRFEGQNIWYNRWPFTVFFCCCCLRICWMDFLFRPFPWIRTFSKIKTCLRINLLFLCKMNEFNC